MKRHSVKYLTNRHLTQFDFVERHINPKVADLRTKYVAYAK